MNMNINNGDKKQVGFWTITSLVSGNLIGSGVFLLPVTLAVFGSISLLGWVVTSIGAVFLSLVFAKLGASTIKTGGPHVYVRQAFGDTAAYYVAWCYWVLSWISNVALISAVVGYLHIFLGGLSPLQTLAIELGIIITFTSINLLGIKVAGRLEIILTVLKLLPLLLVPMFGVFQVQWDNFSPFNATGHSSSSAFFMVMFFTIWAFVGLESGTVPSEEIKNPSKTIPRATIAGTSLAALVYLLGTVTIIGVVPRQMLLQSTAPYADLATLVFGGNWSIWIATAAILCILGTYNGWTLVVSRIAYGAAQDGLFPRFFKKKTKTGAPLWGILVSSSCTMCVVLLTVSGGLAQQFSYVVDIAVTSILLIYLLCIFAYVKSIVLTKHLTFGNVLIALGAFSFNLLAIWAADLKMLLLSIILVLCGIPMRCFMQYQYGLRMGKCSV